MVKLHNIMSMLCPDLEYVATGNNYEDIDWLGQKPLISKKQFEDGFAKYEEWAIKQNTAKETQRQAILDRIGLSADELKTILG